MAVACACCLLRSFCEILTTLEVDPLSVEPGVVKNGELDVGFEGVSSRIDLRSNLSAGAGDAPQGRPGVRGIGAWENGERSW